RAFLPDALPVSFMAVAVLLSCPRALLLLPDARSLLTAGFAALLFLVVLKASGLFGLRSEWPRLFASGGLWLLAYVLPVVLLDGRLRSLLLDWRRNRRLVAAA